MTDFLIILLPWIKSLHVISVIAWMAGLFYLPRLFVHHVEQVAPGSETDDLFRMMEAKLLRVIMNPAMIAAWIFGLMMVAVPGLIDWGAWWPWIKAGGVVGMTGFHMWCARQRKRIAAGENRYSGRHFRMMNEVPTVLLILIVVSVIARPF